MAILDAQNMYGAQNDLFFCKVNYCKAYIKTYNEECPQSLKSFSNEEDFPSKNYNSGPLTTPLLSNYLYFFL